MRQEGSELDYQSILEACGIQDANIQNAVEQRSEYDRMFHEEFRICKKLGNDKIEKNENLSQIKLKQKKKLQKINKTVNKTLIYNEEEKLLQEETTKLNLVLQTESDGFGKKLMKMDDELKELHLQFEGETLTILISETNSKLLSSQDAEYSFQKSHEILKRNPLELDGYEKISTLRCLFPDIPQVYKSEYIEKKIADTKNNIQFLATEYNKKAEFFSKLG